MLSRRTLILTAECLLLGLATSIALALFLAWVRPPINSYRGNVVAIGRPSQPRSVNGKPVVAFIWLFDDQSRLGERTFCWMGVMSQDEWPHPVAGRPRTYAPIDSFFGHEYLPKPEDHPLDRIGTNVARAYGWPMLCLWEGETVDGMNAGLTRWPWNGFSYGGLKVGMAGPLPHYLPTLPLSPGLLADTAIHGATWLALALLATHYRRATLLRRGLCLHCRYDLRATPPGSPCPECGKSRNSR